MGWLFSLFLRHPAFETRLCADQCGSHRRVALVVSVLSPSAFLGACHLSHLKVLYLQSRVTPQFTAIAAGGESGPVSKKADMCVEILVGGVVVALEGGKSHAL